MKGVRIMRGLIISLLIFSVAIISVDAQETLAGMYLDPERITAPEESIFAIDIMVENVPTHPPFYYGCFAWQVNVTWDPAVLSVMADYDENFHYWIPRLTIGDFMAGMPSGTTTVTKINYTAGWYMFGVTGKGDDHGVSGGGWLATIEFNVTSEAYSLLDIASNYYIGNPDFTTYLIDDNLDEIPMTAENAHFVVITEPFPYDINEDGLIDIRDLAMVASKFGEGPDYVGREDCSSETTGVKDGYVDIYDMTYVAIHYGEQYYP